MKILNHDRVKFERSDSGALNITLEDEKTIKDVHCIPLFPFSDPEDFISIVCKKGSEFEEIGIIKHFKKLPSAQQNFVREDIKLRYFIPEITDIKRIKQTYGIWEWDVVTDRGKKRFYLRDRRENITIKDDGRIIITDIEKCRYKITRYNKIPTKARIELDRVLL